MNILKNFIKYTFKVFFLKYSLKVFSCNKFKSFKEYF